MAHPYVRKIHTEDCPKIVSYLDPTNSPDETAQLQFDAEALEAWITAQKREDIPAWGSCYAASVHAGNAVDVTTEQDGDWEEVRYEEHTTVNNVPVLITYLFDAGYHDATMDRSGGDAGDLDWAANVDNIEIEWDDERLAGVDDSLL